MKFSHRVISLPLLAGVWFTAVLAINETSSKEHARLMGELKETHVPALDAAHDVEISLQELAAALHAAAATSDADQLRLADQLSARIERRLLSSEGRDLDRGDAEPLEAAFARYYREARPAAAGPTAVAASDAAQAALDYAALHARVQATSRHEHEEIEAVVDAAQRNQRRSGAIMSVSLFLGLLTLGLVTRSVIRATVGSLRRAVAEASTAADAVVRHGITAPGGDEVAQLVDTLQGVMGAATESVGQMEQAQRLAHIGSWEWDAVSSETAWSEELYRIVGVRSGTRPGLHTLVEHVHPNDHERVSREVGLSFTGAIPYRDRMRIVRPDGEVRTLIVHNEVRTDGTGSMIGLRGVVQDITEMEQTVAALRDSEERYRVLFDHNPMPMWVYDRNDLRFLAVNDAAIAAYGYTAAEFLGMTIADIRPAAERAALATAVAEAAPANRSGVWHHQRKDGTTMDVEISSHDVSFDSWPARLVLASDVTEKRQLEQQFRQSQKMEAIGRLAGGVAHDFNNVLNVIMGYSQMIGRRLPAEDPLRGKVDEILKAVDRASGLTRQLLTFSRKQVVAPQLMDLNAVAADMDKMLRRLIGENVDLRMRLDESLGATLADAGQMEQVIMNLAVNARDAMPDGGTLLIETREVELDEFYVHRHPHTHAGRYVVLTVSDTGCGMDAETQSRVFEPFFTTKAEGKGTGLGLATVYGIVEQSNGRIEIHSEKGRGTTFKIYLPRAEGRPHRAVVGAPAVDFSRGSETVLLVEDEEMVRGIIRETLEQSDYRVLEAATPWQALAIAESHKGAIDVVLTDIVMPGLNGRDLALRLRALRPEVGVLYMSGYSEEAVSEYGLSSTNACFLQKPFTAEALVGKLREALVPATVTAAA